MSDFIKKIKDKKIVKVNFCNKESCEEKIKELTGASSRCIPFDSKANGNCINCNKPANCEIYFSKSY